MYQSQFGAYLADCVDALPLDAEDPVWKLGFRRTSSLVDLWKRGHALPLPADIIRTTEAIQRPPLEVLLHACLDVAPELADEIHDALADLGFIVPDRPGAAADAPETLHEDMSVGDPHDQPRSANSNGKGDPDQQV